MKRACTTLLALTFSAATAANALAITIVNQVEGFLGNTKTQVTTAHNGTTQISYNATGVDKLVVVYAGESGFNTQKVNSLTMSFNGVAMTLAAFENTIFDSTPGVGSPGDFDGGAVGLFYLDNPFQGAATFTAGMTTTGGGANGGHISIIGLSGTLDGVGNTGANWHTQTAAANVSTSLTTSAPNSLVIAGIENSGRNNVTGAIPTAVAPLTLSNNGGWGTGNAWGHGASGFQFVPTSGTTVTPTFLTGSGGNIHVVGAEFLAAPEIAVSGNTFNIVDGDNTPALADGTDFGKVGLNAIATQTFTIDNTGLGILTLSTPVFTGDFSLAGLFPTSIAAGGSATFDILMNTATPGLKFGTISFANNDGDENPFNFSLTGNVVIPEPATASLALLGLAGLMMRRRRNLAV